MSKEIKLIIRPDGVAEKYDDTYDLTIHCTSEYEQREIIKVMETAAKLRQPHGALIDRDALIAQMESDAEQMEEPIAKMFTYAAINDLKHAQIILEAEDGETDG